MMILSPSGVTETNRLQNAENAIGLTPPNAADGNEEVGVHLSVIF
jgi:hypothetical protein